MQIIVARLDTGAAPSAGDACARNLGVSKAVWRNWDVRRRRYVGWSKCAAEVKANLRTKHLQVLVGFACQQHRQHTDGQVVPLAHQVHHPISEGERETHSGPTGLKLDDAGRQVVLHARRYRQTDESSGVILQLRRHDLGFLEIEQDAPRALIKRTNDFSQVQLARGSVEQSGADPTLKIDDAPYLLRDRLGPEIPGLPTRSQLDVSPWRPRRCWCPPPSARWQGVRVG